MTLPPPNLNSDYHGSCVVCQRGTDTALAFTGDAEWLIAGLAVLGIPGDPARLMVEAFFAKKGAEPGMVHTLPVQVCAECVSRTGVDLPAPGVPAFGVPDIRQSD